MQNSNKNDETKINNNEIIDAPLILFIINDPIPQIYKILFIVYTILNIIGIYFIIIKNNFFRLYLSSSVISV